MTRRPLDGVRIVDSSYVIAMPYAFGIMADLGAEVIKIEGPAHIDNTRIGAGAGIFPDNQQGTEWWNRGGHFTRLNRGKKSLTLDLSKEEGRDALKDLIRISDVFVENFTPRVTRRWELDYPNVKKLKPDIVMVSNTGYGHGAGPYSPYPAMATSMEGTHGHVSITGYENNIPSKAGQSFVDFLACWSALLSVGIALHHRTRTGQGQWLDIGMYQVGASFVSEYIMDWLANKRLGTPRGNRHPWRAPQGCYPCAGNDQWCAISVGSDNEWSALASVIGSPDLGNDSRFTTGPDRIKNHDALDEVISQWTKEIDKYEVMRLLQSRGVPAGAVFDAKDYNLSEHHWARGFLEKVQHPPESGIGDRVIMGRPWTLNKTPIVNNGPGPKLGEHNEIFLKHLLGYSNEAYASFEEAAIISERPLASRTFTTPSLDDLVKQGRIPYYDPNYKTNLGI